MHARLIRPLLGVLALVSWLMMPGLARADDVLVFAAASLKTALDEISADWQAQSGERVRISYAGSAQLARQIELGAPADIFISASPQWMDYLAAAELIKPESRVALLGNRLVLIAHGASHAPVDLDRDFNLSELLGDEKLAMALVDAVPAGIYGKEALTSLGQWDAVAPKVAQVDNVRAALALVSSGEAPFGIVYATDAMADANVTVVATFPESSHAPIVYPVAMIKTSHSSAALGFFAALEGAAAQKIFKAQGFEILRGDGNG